MEPLTLAPPRLADLPARLVVGLCERYSMGHTGEIPSQWERFSRYAGKISGGIDGPAYGVCFNFHNNEFDYLCGIEASAADGLPREFGQVRVSAHRYAIFTVQDNISAIQHVIHTIWTAWLPTSGHKAADAPAVECYRENFDPQTGDGGFEIWLAIES